LEPTRFITLDVYSCNKFDQNIVLEFAKKNFEFTSYEDHYIERGVNFE